MSRQSDGNSVHVTEWIKVAVAIVAVLIAVNEFLLKDRQLEREQVGNTGRFLSMGSESAVVQSLVGTIHNATDPELSAERGSREYWQVLAEATPMHEYLVAWSSCVASDLCHRDTGERILCGRLLAYEKLAKSLFQKIDQPYEREQRDKEYSGLLEKCSNAGST